MVTGHSGTRQTTEWKVMLRLFPVNLFLPTVVLQIYSLHTFFISALFRVVPIMIDFLQAREANIARTLEGRHIIPCRNKQEINVEFQA